MTLLAHTREGVVVRGEDLYRRWAQELADADRPVAPAFDLLPDDVQGAWNAVADAVLETIAHA